MAAVVPVSFMSAYNEREVEILMQYGFEVKLKLNNYKDYIYLVKLTN